ncbi:hypothetical protein CCAX7_005830 [Capsulimonas corticalis]|uniref:Uncharacterized protein n=1 Tax=Capsulimonas corticalis TaxID=2219043 RepID=A0A402D3D7_9BACT|nr:hypothetical protein [Capsulimonas corticalis]BDI28532.1 hypothetical protein CCAX7_005830 [Capsulimonas corticalis]
MSFYAYNIAIKGPTQAETASYFEGLGEIGVVTPQENGTTVFSSEDCTEKNHIERLARAASQRFACPALAMHNYDDALLWYQLIVNGQLADEYHSCPAYFDYGGRANIPEEPDGGNARTLCATWGIDNAWIPLIEGIFRETKNTTRDSPELSDEIRNFLWRGGELPSATSESEGSQFARALQALPQAMQDDFLSNFSQACIAAGVGDRTSEAASRFGFLQERGRHAALAAALGLPLSVLSLCSVEEEDMIPEGSILIGIDEEE